MKNKTFILILAGLISTSAFIGAQAPVRNEAEELTQSLERVLLKQAQSRSMVAKGASLFDDDYNKTVELIFRNQQIAFEEAVVLVRLIREQQKEGFILP